MTMHTLSLTELSKALAEKRFSSVELTKHFLTRIAKHDPSLNSFITLTSDIALQQAQAADDTRAKGESHPLLGIPLAHKDIFCTEGVKTSCGSKMLDNFIAPYDATVVSKFKRAGMVMLGKTNMDEFAMGSTNESSYYGPSKNPWDLERVPGGSSGGSAAAVAGRLAPIATGTDTGGSVRQPASVCGITGLKPTYGRVSRYGLISYASSLDQGGLFAASAEDIALTLNTMAGFDEKDSTSIPTEAPDYTQTLNQSIKGLKIAIPKEYFDGLDSEIADHVMQGAKELEKLGAILMDASLPNIHHAVPAYYVIAPAECSANLARYDGVRFGHRCENPKDLQDLYERSRAEGFGAEVKRRILVGTYALSAGFYDAYYVKAQKVRRIIANDYKSLLEKADVILGPTTTSPAYKLGEKATDTVGLYLSDIYTVGVNLAGLPGLSMPSGFMHNLPIGIQLIGNYLEEAKLLNIAHQYQQVTDWHKRIPEGFK